MWVENLCETFDMNYGERLEGAFDKNEIGIKLMHIYSQLYAFHSTQLDSIPNRYVKENMMTLTKMTDVH